MHRFFDVRLLAKVTTLTLFTFGTMGCGAIVDALESAADSALGGEGDSPPVFVEEECESLLIAFEETQDEDRLAEYEDCLRNADEGNEEPWEEEEDFDEDHWNDEPGEGDWGEGHPGDVAVCDAILEAYAETQQDELLLAYEVCVQVLEACEEDEDAVVGIEECEHFLIDAEEADDENVEGLLQAFEECMEQNDEPPHLDDEPDFADECEALWLVYEETGDEDSIAEYEECIFEHDEDQGSTDDCESLLLAAEETGDEVLFEIFEAECLGEGEDSDEVYPDEEGQQECEALLQAAEESGDDALFELFVEECLGDPDAEGEGEGEGEDEGYRQ